MHKCCSQANLLTSPWKPQLFRLEECFFFPKYFFSYWKDVSVLCRIPLNLEKRLDENVNLQKFEFKRGVFKYTLYIWLLPYNYTNSNSGLKHIYGSYCFFLSVWSLGCWYKVHITPCPDWLQQNFNFAEYCSQNEKPTCESVLFYLFPWLCKIDEGLPKKMQSHSAVGSINN